jgi:hypothetical protein
MTLEWVDAKPHTVAGLTVADSMTDIVVICQ